VSTNDGLWVLKYTHYQNGARGRFGASRAKKQTLSICPPVPVRGVVRANAGRTREPGAAPARTARELLARVLDLAPSVEGGELVFATEVSTELLVDLKVLHTGVRALLTGRAWWGSSTDAPVRVRVLNPNEPIPDGIGLLCVADDARWDRIVPAAGCDCPHLFAEPVPRPARGSFRRPHETRPSREQARI
jgi:hypothetical protein